MPAKHSTTFFFFFLEELMEISSCCPSRRNASASLKAFSSEMNESGGGRPTCNSLSCVTVVLTTMIALVVAQRTVSCEVAKFVERDRSSLVTVVPALQCDVRAS